MVAYSDHEWKIPMSDWFWWLTQGAVVAAVVGAILQVLPVVAAVAGGIYYAIQIWETRTIQHWWNNRRMRKKAEKIARLKAKEKVILAQLEAEGVVREAKAKARAKIEDASKEAAALIVHEQAAFEQETKSTPER